MLVWADGFDDQVPLAAKGYQFVDIANLQQSTSGGRVNGKGYAFGSTAAGADVNLTPPDLPADPYCVVGFGFYLDGTQSNLSQPFFWIAEGGTIHLQLGWNTNGSLYVMNSAGTTLGTTGVVVPASTWHFIEIKATINDTTGSVQLRVDGAVVLTLTNIDTRNGGTGIVSRVWARLMHYNGGFKQNVTRIDDFYVITGTSGQDTDYLGDVVVDTLLPSAQGFYAAGVGSDGDSINNYQLVDEAAPSTADYVDLRATGDADTYTFFDTAASTVLGVVVTAYLEKSDAGARSSQQIARIGGTDYNVGSALALSAGTFVAQSTVLDASPATTVAWTAAEVNAAEFGVKAA